MHEQPAAPMLQPDTEGARPRLVLSAGGGAGADSAAADGRDEEFALVGDVTRIGSSPDADVQLHDDTVAPLHAEIRRVADGRYELVGLEGAALALVNGRPESRVELADSHRIEISSSTLVFRNGLGPVAGVGPSGA